MAKTFTEFGDGIKEFKEKVEVKISIDHLTASIYTHIQAWHDTQIELGWDSK